MTKTNQRKKPGPKPGTKRKASSKPQQQINPEVKTEIKLIAVSAFCILLFLCNFHLIGVFGEFISNISFGIFGFLSYIFPLALFFLIAFSISNKNNSIAKKKIVFSILLFAFIGVICQLFVGDSLNTLKAMFMDESASVIKELYLNSSNNRNGGGVIFGGIAFLLFYYIGLIGTVIITLLVCIISIIFLSQKTILKSMKEHSSKIIVTAKSEKAKRREAASQRKEAYEHLQLEQSTREAEQQLLRKDKKVRGVMLDTTIEVEKEEPVLNDIHEINVFGEDEFIGEAVEKISIHGAKPDLNTLNTKMQEIKEVEQIPVNNSVDFRKNAIEKADYEEKHKNNLENIQISKEFNQNNSLANNKYTFPPINLLTKPIIKQGSKTAKELRETAVQLQQTLENFGVKVTITDISHGPVVTRYELQPEQGVKVSKIVGLADDIKLNLAATDIRIEAPIPGKAAIGIEVPNKENSAVDLRELIEGKQFDSFPSNLTFAVGKDIGGEPVLFDISKMPHLLIAGATGSGKSVCINTIIISILYKSHPDDVKLIMIDPKVVELNVYNGIPHLLIPVVTDPKKAAAALHWGVTEMTERYKAFADLNVRDLHGYNKKVELMKNQPNAPLKLPQIVIIVDELADLMMISPSEVEESICRLSQLARAAGIHLIIATQRPSVDVITGLIKANMPSRIAFSVSSGVDSRTILDMNGAEKLLGKGDMLFYPQGYSKPVRIQGAFVSDKDVSSVVDFLKNQAIGNVYSKKIDEQISNMKSQSSNNGMDSSDKSFDIYFEEAGRFILEKEKASIGMLQRVFKIGFNRAARIMDQLCDIGLVTPEEGTKPRKVLMTKEEFEQVLNELNNTV